MVEQIINMLKALVPPLAELIILIVLLFFILKNKKVQAALTNLFKFFGKMQSEDNGLPSQARFNNFYAIIILIPCIAFVLIYTVLNYKDILAYVLDAILLFVSSLFGLKVWQKSKEGEEKKDETNIK